MNRPAFVKPAPPASAARPVILRPEPPEKPVSLSNGRLGQVGAKPSRSLTYWVTSGADVFPFVKRRRS